MLKNCNDVSIISMIYQDLWGRINNCEDLSRVLMTFHFHSFSSGYCISSHCCHVLVLYVLVAVNTLILHSSYLYDCIKTFLFFRMTVLWILLISDDSLAFLMTCLRLSSFYYDMHDYIMTFLCNIYKCWKWGQRRKCNKCKRTWII